MTELLDLALAESLCTSIQTHASAEGLKPLGIAILDAGGHLVLAKREDGAALIRVDVATSKAWTALSLNASSRDFASMAEERPAFANSLGQIVQSPLAPAAGGLRIVSGGTVLGAIGVSGDTSDNDEAAVLAAINGAHLQTA